MSSPTIAIEVLFSGGLEYLFDREPPHPLKLNLTVPASVPVDNSSHIPADGAAAVPTKPADVTYLIHHIRDHYLKERVEMFMENGTLRSGILVIINNTDWELEGEGDYVLNPKDEIIFLSTLHGG